MHERDRIVILKNTEVPMEYLSATNDGYGTDDVGVASYFLQETVSEYNNMIQTALDVRLARLDGFRYDSG